VGKSPHPSHGEMNKVLGDVVFLIYPKEA